MQDLRNSLVQQILEEEMGWKILGPGVYKGFGGQKPIQSDMLVGVPQGEAPTYNEVRKIDGKNYAIISIKSTPGKVIGTEETMLGPTEKRTPGSIEVTMDQGTSGDAAKIKNIQGIIERATIVAKTAQKTMQIMDTVEAAEGVSMSVNKQQVRKTLGQYVRSGQTQRVEVRYGGAAPAP
jgi:hypothetical protein